MLVNQILIEINVSLQTPIIISLPPIITFLWTAPCLPILMFACLLYYMKSNVVSDTRRDSLLNLFKRAERNFKDFSE